MSTYTMQLRKLLQQGFDLGLQNYPIFLESYRETLNAKILNHFYFREIGYETPAQFKFCLNRKMNEIMPTYNKLVTSLNGIKNILSTEYNIEKYIGENESQTQRTFDRTGNQTDSSKGKNVSSNTPQGLLSINSIENEVYATEANIGESNSTQGYNENDTTQDHGNTNASYTKEIEGTNNGKTFAENFADYMDKIRDLDMWVISNLEELFMGVW